MDGAFKIGNGPAIAEAKWWRVLQRFTGRRELLPETITAIAGLVSDRQITW